MDYTLIISVCSILVMFFSAYVAFKSYKLQKDVRKPKLVYRKRKYEFQFYIKDNQFHIVQWLINAHNAGGETAVVDSILFSVKINHTMYMGKVNSTNFQPDLVPPGAPFIIDLSSVLGDNNTWVLKEASKNDDGTSMERIVGIHITELSHNESVSMLLHDTPNMSYRALIQYRLDGTDSTRTQPYGLLIGGLLKEDR